MTRPVGSRLDRVWATPTAHRLHVVVALAALVGVATGLTVGAFEWLVREQLFAAVQRQRVGAVALLPLAGLAVSVVLVRRFGHGDGATTDAFIRSYHERGGLLRLRDLPVKLAACVATLGSGTGFGYEGPSVLIGGTVGSVAERRLSRRLKADDAKVLMVAGAAAGVAAVFKAPLTGVIFALEVPYRQDLARRALLPTLVAASTSYLVFVSLLGTEPVLAFGGTAPFDRRDLVGGIAVGLLCGILARFGAWAVGHAKHLRLPVGVRVVGAGLALAALALLSDRWFGRPLTMGAGYESVTWATANATTTHLLVALLAMRFAATWCTAAGGGVGGLFIPLVTQGALSGAVLQSVVGGSNPGLFPTVGVAAFLGAGYRTPLAGVAFVAEATGEPGFVVPALLAAAASQLVIGRWSHSPFQRDERTSELDA